MAMDEDTINAVVEALSTEHGRSVAEVIETTGLGDRVVRMTMAELYSYGDIQKDDDNGGWMLT